ncbi:MAG: peptidoglycan-binding domain-containing protein, partial [bacterium]
ATPATPTVTAATPATPATPATHASGLSASQVQSILDVLKSFDVDAATMASVKAALEGTTTGSVTSAAVHAFKSDLQLGTLGSEVKALQEFLNSHGYAVAASGAGSPGNETTKFGGLTKAALIKYQKAKGITPAVGYFGPKTRAAVEAD